MLFDTERLLIREWVLEDLELLHALYGDPAISENIGPHLTKEETQQIFENQLNNYHLQDLDGRYVVVDKETNSFIGTFLMRPLANGRVVEIGYAIKKEHWDKGLATELLSKALVFIFANTVFQSIYAFTSLDNFRSKRVLEKCGFTEGERFYEGEEEMNTFYVDRGEV